MNSRKRERERDGERNEAKRRGSFPRLDSNTFPFRTASANIRMSKI